jgi:uncharacterized protein (TIGR02996 family)
VPDLAALIQAVVDAPTEDAPRAAYARAVAATDPERAELIDIQLELARARRAHTEDGHASLNREGTLIRTHGARWAADVRPLVDEWGFLRGFVEDVKLDAARFLTVAPEL